MTRIGELASDRIELNPEVPFPPFPIWLQVPSAWSQLDSNPGTWRRSADDLIDTTFRGSRLPARERREVMALLEGLVSDCQRAGAALSLITVGRRTAGGAASFGIHLAFAGDGRPASLGRVHDILPRTGTTSEITTRSGPAVLHRDRMTMVVPGTAEIAALTSIQIFVPIPGTSWTVVLSTASAYPELTDRLEALLRSSAESIRTGNDEAEDLPEDESRGPDDRRAEPGTRWAEPVDVPTGPGIERGFGTMVVRRIDPPPDSPSSNGRHTGGPRAGRPGTGESPDGQR